MGPLLELQIQGLEVGTLALNVPQVIVSQKHAPTLDMNLLYLNGRHCKIDL